MRPTLAIVILCALLGMGTSRTPVVAAQAAQIDQVTTQAGEPMGPTELNFARWAFTQSALTFVLVLVLISYRRDFFRKIDALRDEKRQLIDALDKSADAGLKQAVATAENTGATKLLAQNVNNLAERRGNHRP